MRVDDLVSKRSVGQVGPLWDVEHSLNGWLSQGSSLGRPELAEDAEEGRLAAAVGSGDQQVHAGLDLEAHLCDQLITVRTVDWHVLEDDVVRENDLSTLHSLLKNLVISSGRCTGACVLGNHNTLVSTIAKVFQNFIHLMNQGSEARQVLDFLVGDDEAADSLSQVDQQG